MSDRYMVNKLIDYLYEFIEKLQPQREFIVQDAIDYFENEYSGKKIDVVRNWHYNELREYLDSMYEKGAIKGIERLDKKIDGQNVYKKL